MKNYWTCSKFADWLRGTDKLKMGTGEQWDEWEHRAKSAHPIRWWLAEEGLDKIQTIFCWIPDKINDIRYYINNRWITRTHCLTAHPRDIPRGVWRDVGNRFLPCLFNELVDFVEVEQAWHHVMWDDEARKKYRTPFSRTFFRFRTWRCPEAGVDYLKWAMTLTNKDFIEEGEKEEPTYQAKAAKEILELYTWWKEIRPKHPDPMDASGWSAYCDACREEHGGSLWASLRDTKNKELKKQGDKAHKLLQKIEAQYEKEDEEMMIRLIKVRQSLWT